MRNPFGVVFGSVLILLGIVFFLDNFGILNADWIFDNFWPIAFIVLGVAFLLRKPSWQGRAYESAAPSPEPSKRSFEISSSEDRIDDSEVFGDIHRQVISKNFAGGHCSVVFGDIVLDLNQIGLLPGEQTLRISSVFGDVRLQLPPELEYSVHASHVAGEISLRGNRRGGLFQTTTYRSPGYGSSDKRLAIHVSSVFGDIDIG